MVIEFLFAVIEKVPELESGGESVTVRMYFMLLNRTLRIS